jgi:hypothetical protein
MVVRDKIVDRLLDSALVTWLVGFLLPSGWIVSISIGLVAIAFTLTGCEAESPAQQTISYKYSIVWAIGVYEHPNYGQAVNWYYADEVRYEGPWVIFKDKGNNNTTTRLPAANVAVYGGE